MNQCLQHGHGSTSAKIHRLVPSQYRLTQKNALKLLDQKCLTPNMLWLILKMAQFWMVATPSLTHFPHSSLLVTTLISGPGGIRPKNIDRGRTRMSSGCLVAQVRFFWLDSSLALGLVVAVFWWTLEKDPAKNPVRWSAGKSYEKNFVLRSSFSMVRFPARHVAIPSSKIPMFL